MENLITLPLGCNSKKHIHKLKPQPFAVVFSFLRDFSFKLEEKRAFYYN